MARPPIRYAEDGDMHIAYQVWGNGPIDLVLVWGLISHCELFWDDPAMVEFLESLGRFARVIQFDKRGTGMSDAISGIPTLDERMDDIRIVMAAAGSDRAAIFGESEGGPIASLFTATFPERVSHLMLFGPLVRLVNDGDFTAGFAPEAFAAWLDGMVDSWGDGVFSAIAMPSRTDQEFAREIGGRVERFALNKGAFKRLMLANAEIDIRPVLPVIVPPTLVLHRVDDLLVPLAHGRYYADHIDGAQLIELDGPDHYVASGDSTAVAREMRRFVSSGAGAAPPDVDVDVDRVLATVLFTDIVGSTEAAARLGDRKWRDLLDDHDRLVRQEVERHRGRVVKTTGDGALATFDGPARGVRTAQSIAEGVRRLGIQIRAGVHTGEVELRGDDVGGVGVHIGARVSALADPGQVLVSRTVVDLVVGSGLEFADAGVHHLKGVPGDWPLFALSVS
ncbi:MAG TPA: adenylate/guanylate cyclase domain-containing protein [Acidimicrobiales bacterium]|nr:adenylate/guanylate cyclase domain-containing protein [Acidimicrobiales bacterium]